MAYKVDWKKFSGKEKIEYIWEYYKIPIILVICAVIFVVSMVVNRITYRAPLINVIMINSNVSGELPEKGFRDFLENHGYEIFEGAVECQDSLNFEEGADEREHEILNLENYQVLSAWMLSGENDLFMGTGIPFLNMANQGALVDLSTVLPEELLKKFEEELLYVDKDGEIEPYPCAIHVKENFWLEENGYYEECYIGVIKGGNNPEIATEFIEFLLSE